MKTTTVRARSEAIRLFLKQIKLRNGIPSDIRIPNDATLKTFSDTDKNKNLTRHKTSETMFKKLGK